jgi:hypothetical protein
MFENGVQKTMGSNEAHICSINVLCKSEGF